MNELAYDFPGKLKNLDVDSYAPLLEGADKVLLKLSNYRTYIEIGSDPHFRDKGINWDTVYGTEYMIFKEVVGKVRILHSDTR